jgi:hypothetical protein
MVTMRIVALMALAVSLFGSWAAETRPARVCNPETGDAVREDIKDLNSLKNREGVPATGDFDPSVTLPALLTPGDDEGRFAEDRAGTVVGYVANAKVGGVETVNCHATDVHDRDTHIELTLTATDAPDETKHVIVEVTPRWRARMAAQGVDWETSTLRNTIKGQCVKVSGWMLFDFEHKGQAEHTAPGGDADWRATAWEIHPITSLEVLPSCPQ